MAVRTRIRRLLTEAQRLGLDAGPGCPACRERQGRIVIATSRRLADDTIEPVADHPAACSRCGRVPEMIVEFVEPWEPA